MMHPELMQKSLFAKREKSVASIRSIMSRAVRNAYSNGKEDRGKALHLMGIVSFFSSHGSINHLLALMDIAKQEEMRDVFIHAMLGRRGEMRGA